MISVKQAQDLVCQHTNPLAIEKIPVSKALHRFLYSDVLSPISMPPFRQSAMDGYALHLHDAPTYRLIDEVKAGDGHHPVLQKGEAIRIFTGAAVPDSANAVIMQEKVTVIQPTIIRVEKEVKESENIRPLGEQVKKNQLALSANTQLTAAAIGYLTSLGITTVEVYQAPKIAVVSTGNELVEAGQSLPYGKIYESNSVMIQNALLSTIQSNITTYKVADDYVATRDLLATIIQENDVVLISGGISVGDYDYVGKALHEIGVNEIFYKVKQKPGKPLFFGKKEQKSIFALPGNPAAALTAYYVYVLPALQKMIGNPDYKINTVDKKSTSIFTKIGDRAQFLKAHAVGDNVQILEGQSSAMLQTFALANALVFVPEDVMKINAGDTVPVILLQL